MTDSLMGIYLLHWVLAGVTLLAAVIATVHALFYKRDPRAVWGWMAVIIIFPLAGPLLYALFGVNRVRTKGSKLLQSTPFSSETAALQADILADAPPPYENQSRTSFAITGLPLVTGNDLTPLHNGEEAFPLMLEAIEGARKSVHLVTYIFEGNDTGIRFADALARAVQRGVDVRVVVDGVGEITAPPRIGPKLRKRKVPFARFLPPRLIPPSLSINLRCHHKILVVDGEIGFTGGMNIGDRYLVATKNPKRVMDMHFRVRGPLVAQLEEVAIWAWNFCTEQDIHPPLHVPKPVGSMMCRSVVDGPDDDMDKLPAILQAACAAAQSRLTIMTPYFLPPRELVGALQTAALRGVAVEVLIPKKSDLPFMDRATRNMLWEVLRHGVRIFHQPSPFPHTKLFIVDENYALIGSTNLDPRSLRLNFEFAVEVYDRDFARKLLDYCDAAKGHSRETSLEEVDGRAWGTRFLDSLCWLFSPYL